ncbi:MAG: hypothetical protein K2X35_18525 [Bryobacteraceae bacterium]|nr:hypothetical protein [Bryobacteraceae bacterium]
MTASQGVKDVLAVASTRDASARRSSDGTSSPPKASPGISNTSPRWTRKTFRVTPREFYWNNVGPLQAEAAIVAMLGQYWPTFAGLRHDLVTILGNDQHFMLEALNHYTRLDGSPVTLRAVAITARNDAGKVISARIYTDTSPLFNRWLAELPPCREPSAGHLFDMGTRV